MKYGIIIKPLINKQEQLTFTDPQKDLKNSVEYHIFNTLNNLKEGGINNGLVNNIKHYINRIFDEYLKHNKIYQKSINVVVNLYQIKVDVII